MLRWHFTALCSLLALAAGSGCGGPAASAARSAPGEEQILSAGGELAALSLPDASVTLEHGQVHAWGSTEVPGASNVQAAVAIAEAAARTELLKAIEVAVSEAFEDVVKERGDAFAQAVTITTTAAVKGQLPQTARTKHGWTHIQRDARHILRAVARISVAEHDLVGAISRGLLGTPQAEKRAARIVASFAPRVPFEVV